ncbi:MAG TPA: J domain-containing protein [Egibacteraceae bacterium]|nr:J domain-containing protein [Egibacteraceae bacterium]
MRDLYEILGVSRDASEDEIKRAYRRRARELHPDAGGDEEEFKELTTAYEVLKNPTARQNYDRFGDPRGPGGGGGDPFAGFGDISDLINAFFGGGFSGQTSRAPTGAGRDAIVDTVVTLEEASEGVRRDLEVTVPRTCTVCEGSGAEPGTRPVQCTRCGGSGAVQQVTRSLFGQMLTSTVCPTCRGTGDEIPSPCRACGGEGRDTVTDVVTVDIPAGVDDGTRLRVLGRGESGRRGAPSGDLYVRVRVRPHEVFTRDGNDLHCELRLSMTQAALGGDVPVMTLYGEELLRIEPGTQPGEVLTLRRQGMPKLSGGGARGNLYVHCRVETPRRLDDEQAELLRRFAELRGETVADLSSNGRGILGRLRGAFGA